MKDNKINQLLEIAYNNKTLFYIQTEAKKNDLNDFLEKAKKNIILSETESKEFINDSDKISQTLFRHLIDNEQSFEIIKKLKNREIFRTNIVFLNESGESTKKYKLSQEDVINYYNEYQTYLSDEQKEKIQNLFSFDNYIEENKEKSTMFMVDRKSYAVKFIDMINFFNMNDSDYYDLINNPNAILHEMPLKYFIYCITQYFYENRILFTTSEKKTYFNYIMNEKMMNRLKALYQNQIIDIEAINKYLNTKDSFLNQIKINTDLKNKILEGIPQNLNNLEKAIWIYIKMCKILTYDQEFYATNQQGEIARKHENIEHVSEITPTSNGVVCYEFNAIYGKILNELSINYESENKGNFFFGDEIQFGGGHANLTFRYEDIIVRADSVASILQGDLFQAKLNQPLSGLICINRNSHTQELFKKTLSKIYKLIAEQEEKITSNNTEEYETFEEILKLYRESTDNIRPISVEERIIILLTKINNSKLIGVDAMSYLLQLRKILFSEKERESLFKAIIIRDNGVKQINDAAAANAILAFRILNQNGILETKYYFYSPGKNIIELTKDEINNLLDEKQIEYIGNDSPRIPGLKRS